jgi:hypothetical protein
VYLYKTHRNICTVFTAVNSKSEDHSRAQKCQKFEKYVKEGVLVSQWKV